MQVMFRAFECAEEFNQLAVNFLRELQLYLAEFYSLFPHNSFKVDSDESQK